MTLPDALIHLAPPDAAATEAEAQRRREAMAIVFQALGTLARRAVPDENVREDVVSLVLIKLVDQGPADPHTIPSDEPAARAWLRRVLRNRWIDLRRRGGRETELPPDDLSPTATPDLPDLDQERRETLLQEASSLVFDDIVPDIARSGSGRFDREGFIEAIAQMRALYRDAVTVDDLAAGLTGCTRAAARNRIYKQHERARTRLLQELPARLDQRKVDPLVRTAACAIVQLELAPRVARGDQR
ncbi:MAG TPA: hypothetical protein VIL35_11460 [Vicinamibacterales bacterium]